MAHVNAFVAQSELYFCRQFQQAEEVGYGGAFFAYAFAEAFLRQLVLVDQFFECQGYFYGIQILSLNVLDQSHLG